MAAGKQAMPGDWTCPNCQDLVFARNGACRRCATPKHGGGKGGPPGAGGAAGGAPCGGGAAGAPSDIRPGDWHCPACFDLQFARNAACRRCGTPHPASMGENVASQQAMTAATFYGSAGGAAAAPAPGGGGGQDVRPGDWICPRCSDLVFAKNDACRRCNTSRPTGSGMPGGANGYGSKTMDWGGPPAVAEAAYGGDPRAPKGELTSGNAQVSRPGDWICPSCGDLQFARNTSCRRCGQLNPGAGEAGSQLTPHGGSNERHIGSTFPAGGGGTDMRPGDWLCPRCNDHVFAKNNACRRCSTPRPSTDGGGFSQVVSGSQNMKPGDWYCPQCNDLQFARNAVCRMCSTPRPSEDGLDGNGQRLRSRSPYRAT